MNFTKNYHWLYLPAFLFLMFYKPILLFLLLGALIVSYAIHYFYFLHSIRKHGKDTMGKIISYERDDEGYKTPLIEFEINGIKIIKIPHYHSSTDLSKFKTYKQNINQTIPILYNPKDPEKFVIKSESAFNYGSLVFSIIVGLIFIFISLAQLFNYISIDGMS